MTVTAWLLIGLFLLALFLVAVAAAELGAPPTHSPRRPRTADYIPMHSARPRPCECAYHLSE